ncbi:MAG: hypothetical protein AB1894_28785 [Chloroflexota bacterium]
MKYAVLIVSLVVLAYLIMDFNSRTAEMNRLAAEKERVSQQLEYRLETKAALQTQIAYATSEAAAIEYGYKHHMIREGDTPVKLVEGAESTPTPTPKPQVAPTQVSNLQRWLQLFFDPPEN